MFCGQNHTYRHFRVEFNPKRIGRNGAGWWRRWWICSPKNAKQWWNLQTRPVYLCATESRCTFCRVKHIWASHVTGEAVKAAAASSEFSHVARLGEQGKTSRHRRSQAIYRPPLPPAGKWGRGATWSMIQNEMILMNAGKVPHFTSASLSEPRCCWRRRVRYVHLGRLIYPHVATFDSWSRELWEFYAVENNSKGEDIVQPNLTKC